MVPFLIAALVIILAAAAGQYLYAHKQKRIAERVIRNRFDRASKRAETLQTRCDEVRTTFGEANAIMMTLIGVVLTICFAFAANTALGVYGWIFKGLGWSESSATTFAIVPFMVVFVTAFILKLFIWDDAKKLFGNKGANNLFGRRVAAVASLILFTGIVFQLSPFASVRSELVMGRQVAQAQEELAAVEVECAVESAADDCGARLQAAETSLASAESRLEKGKEVDETMAKIVPFAEMVTAFGPIILIEVFSMVTLPLLLKRSAERKRNKLSDKLVNKEEKAAAAVTSAPKAPVDVREEPVNK